MSSSIKNKALIFIIILFAGCKQTDYPNYSLTNTGVYYQYHTIGDAAKKVDFGDFITIDLTYKTLKDSIFFSARRKIEITEPAFEGAIDECFAMLCVDDSASFIINSNNFFEKTLNAPVPSFISKDDPFIVVIKVHEVKTKEDFLKEKKEFLSWIEDFSDYEQVLLTHYIEKEQVSVDPYKSGLYHSIIESGNGTKVKLGDTIVVHYEGRFLNGKMFDSTWRRKSAFEFVYGQEWQVIRGLEEALGKMTEGEMAFFIMPSSIAFGNKGSSTGIIPPFTSVVFKVNLIEIRPATINVDSLNHNL